MGAGWRTMWAVCAAAFILLFTSRAICGQAVNATLLGTVTDSSEAVVAGASVTIKEMNTGFGRTTATNDSGNYEFANLPPGEYEVTVQHVGFKKALRTGVHVLVNSDVRVNLMLDPGSASETIKVTTELPVLQTDRADVGRKIETKQVEDLPLGTNRNFQGLISLVPGSTRAHRDHSEFFNAQDSLSSEINGVSRMANNLQLEGVDDNERTGLLQILIPPNEAIETVDVTTSNYAAEFGRAGGAVTNVILKSGTNEFHGAAYEFNRISALAARNFFNAGSIPPTTYNYYGANLGGPIFKNKTFFFMDFLRISDHRGQFNTFTLPTADFRSGDFSASPTVIYDPATGNPDGSGRQQISCNGRLNVICPNRISPIARNILALVPLPPSGAGFSANFRENTHFRKTTNSFDVKIDHNISQKDRLSYRYSRSGTDLFQEPAFGSAGGPAQGGFQGTGTQNAYNTAADYTHVFSSALLSEVRIGVSHYRNITQNTDYGSKASDAIGITGVNLDPFTSGLAGIDIGGGYSSPLVGFSASMPWVRGETNINIVNNWTKISGNHTFKWGADIRRVRDDLVQGQTFSHRGIFRFRDGQTALNTGGKSSKTSFANQFASFLLDTPSQVGRDVNVQDASYRETEFFAYGQDQWKVSAKLTLDLGLRWEFYPPATPRKATGFSNYDPATNSLVIAGIGGNPKNLGRKTKYKDFAPRIGVAYRLGNRTVVRAGFGMSYSPFPDNQYAFNFPVRQNIAFNSLSSFTQALLSNGQPASMASGFPALAAASIPPNGIITNARDAVYTVVNLDYREPYLEFWNVSVQRALPKNFVLEAAYVGNHGVRVPAVYNLNAGLVAGAGAKGRPLFPRKSDTNFLFLPTSSNYNALQVKLDRRFTGGFLLTTAYTYGKALGYKTDGGGVGSISNYLNFRWNYAPVDYNRTHTFVQSYVYDLPFGKGKPFVQSGIGNRLLGGWQVSGIMTIMSGLPLNFTASGVGLNAPGTTQVPNINGPFRVLHGVATQPWFDTSVFTTPAGPVFGNLGRNVFSGPKFFNLDAAVFRRVAFSERIGLELRAEAFGLTNTPQFGLPVTNLTSPNFGFVTGTVSGATGGATGSRSVELGAKITF